jgi:hypothetical protein
LDFIRGRKGQQAFSSPFAFLHLSFFGMSGKKAIPGEDELKTTMGIKNFRKKFRLDLHSRKGTIH